MTPDPGDGPVVRDAGGPDRSARDAGPSDAGADARAPGLDGSTPSADGGGRPGPCGAWTRARRFEGTAYAPMVHIESDGHALLSYVEETRSVKLRTSDAIDAWTSGVSLLGQSNGNLLSEPRGRIMVIPDRRLYTWVDPDDRVVLGFTIDGAPIRPRVFQRGRAPRIAVDPGGGALLAWAGGPAGLNHVQINEGGGTTTTLTLPGTEGVQTESVAVAIGGGIRALAWLDQSGSVLVSADTGDGFAPPFLLGGGSGYASRPSLAVNGRGDALVAWVEDDAVQVATRTETGWTGVEVLETSGAFAFLPHVVLADSGRATAAWERRTADGTELRVADRDIGGAWDAPVTLSASAGDGMVDKIDLALGDDGVVHALFLRPIGDRPGEVAVACRHPERGWTVPVRLDSGGELVSPATSVGASPSIAAGGGRVIATWVQDGEIRLSERE